MTHRRVAFITGGSRGIGAATARALARDGAAVAIADLLTDEGRITSDEIRKKGGESTFLECDVTNEEDVARCLSRTAEQFGGLDVLVNNAAIKVDSEFPQKIPFAEWHRSIEVIFHGSYFCAKHAAEIMIAGGRGGRIVNVTSVHELVSEAGATGYDAAKGAVAAFGRALAVELAPHNILVNNVAPGFVDTDMMMVEGKSAKETEMFREYYVGKRKIPLARAAGPEEIAEVIAFVASPRNTYMTGATVVVDGGLTITF